MDYFRLRVIDIIKENKQTKSIVFAMPIALEKTFTWLAGQYVDIRVAIAGKKVTRSYSISNDSDTQGLRITVKALYKGTVSNYLVKKLKIGQELEVSRPRGRFHLPAEIKSITPYVFFAAGSGVMPIYAMICQLLKQSNQSKVILFYANSNAKSIIFYKALHVLAKQFPHRFVVCHCLSQTGFFDSVKPWHKGRTTPALISKFIREQSVTIIDASFYLCGPDSFMRLVSDSLTSIGVDATNINQESFGAGKQPVKAISGVAAQLTVEDNGTSSIIEVNANETLLSAMLRHNIDAPYSCEEGVCGNCQCQLKAGQIAMADNLFLTEKEEQQGYILSCQAVAQTNQVTIKL